MHKYASNNYTVAVWRWLPAVLLLALATAGFAVELDLGSDTKMVPTKGFSFQLSGEQPETEAGAETYEEILVEKTGWRQIPPWLQIIITVGIALLIYFIILAIFQKRQKSTEEIIHYKDVEGSTGFRDDQPRGPVSVPGRQPLPRENRMPPQDPSGGQSRPQPAKKNTAWPFFVAAIVIFNIIRRCVQDN